MIDNAYCPAVEACPISDPYDCNTDDAVQQFLLRLLNGGALPTSISETSILGHRRDLRTCS